MTKFRVCPANSFPVGWLVKKMYPEKAKIDLGSTFFVSFVKKVSLNNRKQSKFDIQNLEKSLNCCVGYCLMEDIHYTEYILWWKKAHWPLEVFSPQKSVNKCGHQSITDNKDVIKNNINYSPAIHNFSKILKSKNSIFKPDT